MENNESKNRELPTDEEIIGLYWDRNEEAIAKTDKKYRAYLYTIAYNVLRDEYESDESLNDTYFSVWNKIPPQRPSFFRGFISKITRGISIDKYRAKSAKRRIPSQMIVSLDELDDCISFGDTSEEEAFTLSVAEAMNTFLHSLSTNDAFAFICRYYYFDSIESIANMMNVGVGAVYKRLSRLRGELRELLVKEGIFND